MLHFPPMLRNQVILLLLLGCAWATSSGASGIVDEGCVNGQRVKRRARPGRVRLQRFLLERLGTSQSDELETILYMQFIKSILEMILSRRHSADKG